VTSGTGTVTRSTPTAASSLTAIAGAASPAPRDAGCPNINGTFYTPSDASGKLIAIQSDGIYSDQIFVQLCNTNYPSGAEYGNPGIYDILKMYVPSLEDCITACAYYNRQYQINQAKGVPRTGLCKSVAIVKAGRLRKALSLLILKISRPLIRMLICRRGRVLLPEERYWKK
jgi:hypothetical protein